MCHTTRALFASHKLRCCQLPAEGVACIGWPWPQLATAWEPVGAAAEAAVNSLIHSHCQQTSHAVQSV